MKKITYKCPECGSSDVLAKDPSVSWSDDKQDFVIDDAGSDLECQECDAHFITYDAENEL